MEGREDLRWRSWNHVEPAESKDLWSLKHVVPLYHFNRFGLGHGSKRRFISISIILSKQSMRVSALSPKIRIVETLPIEKSGFFLNADALNSFSNHHVLDKFSYFIVKFRHLRDRGHLRKSGNHRRLRTKIYLSRMKSYFQSKNFWVILVPPASLFCSESRLPRGECRRHRHLTNQLHLMILIPIQLPI